MSSAKKRRRQSEAVNNLLLGLSTITSNPILIKSCSATPVKGLMTHTPSKAVSFSTQKPSSTKTSSPSPQTKYSFANAKLNLSASSPYTLVRTPASQWTGQSCSNLLNSLARLHELQLAPRHVVLEVFEYVSQVVRASEIYMYEGVYDAQNVAIMCNGMARIDYRDQDLLLHLSLIIQQMHPDQFDVQAVSNIVNAYVKLDVEPEVRRYLLEFMSVVIQCFDADEEFSAQVRRLVRYLRT